MHWPSFAYGASSVAIAVLAIELACWAGSRWRKP
jgi:hypothetical protein